VNQFIAERAKDQTAAAIAGDRQADSFLSPLNPIGNSRDPIELLTGDATLADSQVNVIAEHLPDDRIRVTCKATGAVNKERIVTYWTAPDLPVLTRCELITYQPARRTIIQLSDFVKCSDRYVARTIRLCSLVDSQPVQAREWHSDDLGNEEPRDEDFVLPVDRHAGIQGLKEWPEISGSNFRIDFNTLTEADLGSNPKGLPPGVILPDLQPPPDPSLNYFLIINVALILVAICGWLIWRQAGSKS